MGATDAGVHRVSVAALIVAEIIFHFYLAFDAARRRGTSDKEVIDREIEAATRDDEMTLGVAHRASSVGLAIAMLGIVAAFIALATGASAVTGLHIFLASFVASAFAWPLATIWLMERGSDHG